MAKIVKRTIGNGETRYVVDFYDLTGTRRKERFRRERDAKGRLGEVLAQRETGELRARADDLRFTVLVDKWRLARWPDLRDNTREVYGRLLDVHLLPMLGQRKLRTIVLEDCDQLRASVQDSTTGNRQAKGGRVTANLALGLLRQIMNYAEKHRLVASNVVRHSKARPAPFEEQRQRIDRAILAPDELRRLFDAADGVYKVLLMTAALTGLRRGELLGLQWADIEWASSRLHVRQQMQRGKLVPPKSPSALRAVPLPGELIRELKRWRLACPKGERDLMFPNTHGSALIPTNVSNYGLRPALRRAGLRHVSLHALRHGYASALVSAGVSIKVVQRVLGHANIQMTLNTYAHLLPGDDDNAAAALSARVFGGRTGNFLGTSEPEGPANRAAAGMST